MIVWLMVAGSWILQVFLLVCASILLNIQAEMPEALCMTGAFTITFSYSLILLGHVGLAVERYTVIILEKQLPKLRLSNHFMAIFFFVGLQFIIQLQSPAKVEKLGANACFVPFTATDLISRISGGLTVYSSLMTISGIVAIITTKKDED
jgi:hypothetical protein